MTTPAEHEGRTGDGRPDSGRGDATEQAAPEAWVPERAEQAEPEQVRAEASGYEHAGSEQTAHGHAGHEHGADAQAPVPAYEEPTERQSTQPESTAWGSSDRESDARQSTQPATTDAEATDPETSGPDTTGPDTTGPDTTGPDTTGPGTISPDLTDREGTRGERVAARTSPVQESLPGSPAAPTLGPTGRPTVEFPEPPALERHGPARVVAMCNQKGGVGKTTTTINLGAALAEQGRRVLLVDFDPQGALSVGLGFNPLELDRTVYNLLMERGITVEDVLLKTDVAGLDLLPSNIDLSAAEVQLVGEVAREQTLTRVLRPVISEYDIILIDCQPSLGLLTVNALTAAQGVIIPTECEFFALRGVALLVDTITKVQERLNPDLEIEGLLATMYDSRTVHSREVVARLVDAFGERVFHTVINRTIKFPETTVVGEPITTYASSSAGATAYRQLAREVLARWAVG